jgi:hypothetical protein
VITDLTSEGCCIFTVALPVSEGLHLWIKPEAFEPLPGKVRWVDRGYAGIEFDKVIYEPVAKHLQETFAALGN